MSKNIVYKAGQGKAKGEVIVLRLIIAGMIIIGIAAIIIVLKYGGGEKKREVEVTAVEQAAVQYELAVKEASASLKMIESGDYESVRPKLEFARANGADTAAYYLACGQLAIKDRKYLEAGDFLEKATAKGDNKSQTWVLLICALQWAGEDDRQIVAVSQAIEKNRNSPGDLIWIARQLEKFEMYEPALQIYSVASVKPEVALEAALAAGRCSLKLGKLTRAEKFLEHARKLDSGNPQILPMLEELQRQREQLKQEAP